MQNDLNETFPPCTASRAHQLSYEVQSFTRPQFLGSVFHVWDVTKSIFVKTCRISVTPCRMFLSELHDTSGQSPLSARLHELLPNDVCMCALPFRRWPVPTGRGHTGRTREGRRRPAPRHRTGAASFMIQLLSGAYWRISGRPAYRPFIDTPPIRAGDRVAPPGPINGTCAP